MAFAFISRHVLLLGAVNIFSNWFFFFDLSLLLSAFLVIYSYFRSCFHFSMYMFLSIPFHLVDTHTFRSVSLWVVRYPRKYGCMPLSIPVRGMVLWVALSVSRGNVCHVKITFKSNSPTQSLVQVSKYSTYYYYYQIFTCELGLSLSKRITKMS